MNDYSPGAINVEGCVFDDFLLTNNLPPEKVPAVIERDRLIMSARDGFNRKLLPLRIEQDSNNIYCGGRYLLNTFEDAQAFAHWCEYEFEIDGVLILERPDFKEISTNIFRVIGAHDFKDIHTSQTAYRTEIWKTSDSSVEDKLIKLWPETRDRAEEENKASLWLLHNADAGEISIVTVIDRVGENSEEQLDYASLRALETSDSYGSEWNWAEKTFDRSHWVYTVWFPNSADASTKPSLWPNSPPLPRP
jgi:hypothetical protein